MAHKRIEIDVYSSQRHAPEKRDPLTSSFSLFLSCFHMNWLFFYYYIECFSSPREEWKRLYYSDNEISTLDNNLCFKNSKLSISYNSLISLPQDTT